VLLCVRFACVFFVLYCVAGVPSCSVSMMGSFLVLSSFMVLSCFPMVASGMRVMFRSFPVMFGRFSRHMILLEHCAKQCAPSELNFLIAASFQIRRAWQSR
jgi:hypothetical protein